MKEYCVDLEIAKELKENGFPQECVYKYFIDHYKDKKTKDYRISFSNATSYRLAFWRGIYSAPISDEILKELPQTIKIDNNECIFELTILVKNQKEFGKNIWYKTYIVAYSQYLKRDNFLQDSYFSGSKKLSNNLARMWLYLKKEGYIK